MNENFLFTLNGKKYGIDLNKVKEVCFVCGNEILTDNEITDVTNLDEENGGYLSQKFIKENKYPNTQTDILMVDLVKIFIGKLMENDSFIQDQKILGFSSSLAFNTLLNCGIIIEL